MKHLALALILPSLAAAEVPKHSRQEIIAHAGETCAIGANFAANSGLSSIDTTLKQSWFYSIIYSKCILSDSSGIEQSEITDRKAAKAYSECVDAASVIADSDLQYGSLKQHELVGRSTDILTECLYENGEKGIFLRGSKQ